MHKHAIYKLTPDAVYDYLEVSASGLSEKTVIKRQNEFGKNVLRSAKGQPLWAKFLHHFSSMMAILLWFGGAIAFVVDMPVNCNFILH